MQSIYLWTAETPQNDGQNIYKVFFSKSQHWSPLVLSSIKQTLEEVIYIINIYLHLFLFTIFLPQMQKYLTKKIAT